MTLEDSRTKLGLRTIFCAKGEPDFLLQGEKTEVIEAV